MIAREGGGKVFFLYDRLSARATITDGQGGIQGRQSHLPFGEELVATGTTDKHRFTSYERDSETATDYAVNRGYSPSVGRFSQADPYDGSYDFGDPQSLNRYAYVQNDPVNLVDPLGLLQICHYRDARHERYEVVGCMPVPTNPGPLRTREPASGGGQFRCTKENIDKVLNDLNTALNDRQQSEILATLQAIAGAIFAVSVPLGGAEGEEGLGLSNELSDHATSIFGNFHNPPPQNLVDDTNRIADALKAWLNRVKGKIPRSHINSLDDLSLKGNNALGDIEASLDALEKCKLEGDQNNKFQDLKNRFQSLNQL